MHTELATVPDFTLLRHSRQPGDCKRYALKAIAHGANHDQKDTGRHDPCGGSHHACFLEQDFRSVWPDGTT
jgi:hypothetical protein